MSSINVYYSPKCHIHVLHVYRILTGMKAKGIIIIIIDYMFVFVEAIFVAPRAEELGIATLTGWNLIVSKGCQPFK